MTGERWRWRRSEPNRLAEFVLAETFVGHSLVRLNGHRPSSETAFEIAACLYENLLHHRLGYTMALSPNDGRGSEEQYILRPIELLQGSRAGDCVNLSLLFAGMCAAVELRPHLVLMSYENRDEGHMMVVLPKYVGRSTMDVRTLLTLSQDQVAADLVRALQEEKALAVDLIWCTETYGCRAFAEAREQGCANLESAVDVRVLDVLDLQRHFPPRKVGVLPEVPKPAPRPRSRALGGPVREDFAERLGANPARWDRPSLEALHTRPGTEAHTTRAALLAALDALPAFETVGGRRPSLARLQTIYYRTVHRDPATSSAESLLVEAAAVTGWEGTLSPLVKFVLGVAAAHDRGMEIAPLMRWLESSSAQLGNAREYLRKHSVPVHWALVDLGPDDPEGELDWSGRSVSVQVEPPIPGIEPRTYGSPAELETALAKLMKDLLGSLPDDARLLVDIIAPRAMLELGIEHWNLLGDKYDEISLRSRHAPRFRWAIQFHDANLRRKVRERADKADWSGQPSRMDRADAADDEATGRWLGRYDVKTAPALIGGAYGGTGDPLAWMLGKGHGFIFWYPSGDGGSEILERWGEPSGEPGYVRDTLPERVLDGLPTERVPVLIWNDLGGRDGFELSDGRPQSPSGGSE